MVKKGIFRALRIAAVFLAIARIASGAAQVAGGNAIAQAEHLAEMRIRIAAGVRRVGDADVAGREHAIGQFQALLAHVGEDAGAELLAKALAQGAGVGAGQARQFRQGRWCV